ncbi:MAG: hypothetical protein PHI90_07700 [Clostridia bacterium]|nr:hypothetical protein [Clostridia bacterium]MDD4048685.1 hypothetical protein [Clostridia bacterium]
MSRYQDKYPYEIITEPDDWVRGYKSNPFTRKGNIAFALKLTARKLVPWLSMKYLNDGYLVLNDDYYSTPVSYEENIRSYKKNAEQLLNIYKEYYVEKYGMTRDDFLFNSNKLSNYVKEMGIVEYTLKREINEIERDLNAKVDLLKCHAMLRAGINDKETIEIAIELEKKFGNIKTARDMRKKYKGVNFRYNLPIIEKRDNLKSILRDIDAKIGFSDISDHDKDQDEKIELMKNKFNENKDLKEKLAKKIKKAYKRRAKAQRKLEAKRKEPQKSLDQFKDGNPNFKEDGGSKFTEKHRNAFVKRKEERRIKELANENREFK